jgi:hypothetical protein
MAEHSLLGSIIPTMDLYDFTDLISMAIILYIIFRQHKRIDRLEDTVKTHTCNCKTFGVELDVIKEQLKNM